MKTYRITGKLRGNYSPTATAIGLFDGVHLGHEKLLQQALKLARERGIESAVITFDPDPAEVYSLYGELPHLSTPHQKYRRFESLGIDRLYIIEFNYSFASLTPDQFIEYLNRLNVRELVCGFDFTFGFRGNGTCKHLLNSPDRRFNVNVIDSVDYRGKKISSSRIITELTEGDFSLTRNLLGYDYTLEDMQHQYIPTDGKYLGKYGDEPCNITVKDGLVNIKGHLKNSEPVGSDTADKLSIVFEKRV